MKTAKTCSHTVLYVPMFALAVMLILVCDLESIVVLVPVCRVTVLVGTRHQLTLRLHYKLVVLVDIHCQLKFHRRHRQELLVVVVPVLVDIRCQLKFHQRHTPVVLVSDLVLVLASAALAVSSVSRGAVCPIDRGHCRVIGWSHVRCCEERRWEVVGGASWRQQRRRRRRRWCGAVGELLLVRVLRRWVDSRCEGGLN